jgi:hypothetical protein
VTGGALAAQQDEPPAGLIRDAEARESFGQPAGARRVQDAHGGHPGCAAKLLGLRRALEGVGVSVPSLGFHRSKSVVP